MKILVKLTEQIFEKSKECGTSSTLDNHNNYSRNCFFALTLSELFPDCRVVYLHVLGHYTGVGLIVKTNNGRVEIRLPEIVFHYIQAWDAPVSDYFQQTIPVEQTHIDYVIKVRRSLPLISFELDIPDSLIDCIGISQIYKVLSEYPQKLELVQP